MKSLEFMYWLQGYFENFECETINEQSLQTIKRHLDMVHITDGKQLLPFCSWLQGFLVAIEDNPLTQSQTKSIKDKLSGIFQHVVSQNIEQRSHIAEDRDCSQSIMIKC